MFLEAIFTITRIWWQAECPSVDECIMKMWYILMEHYSHIKKEWHFAICSNMDGIRGHYYKWNKTEKDKYCIISSICGILKIQQTHEYNKKKKQIHSHIKVKLPYHRKAYSLRCALGKWLPLLENIATLVLLLSYFWYSDVVQSIGFG